MFDIKKLFLFNIGIKHSEEILCSVITIIIFHTYYYEDILLANITRYILHHFINHDEQNFYRN